MRANGKGSDFCVVGVGRTGKGGVRECLEQVSSQSGFFPPIFFFSKNVNFTCISIKSLNTCKANIYWKEKLI